MIPWSQSSLQKPGTSQRAREAQCNPFPDPRKSSHSNTDLVPSTLQTLPLIIQHEPKRSIRLTRLQCPVALLLVTSTSCTSALHTAPSCPTQLVMFGLQRCLASPFSLTATQQKPLHYKAVSKWSCRAKTKRESRERCILKKKKKPIMWESLHHLHVNFNEMQIGTVIT